MPQLQEGDALLVVDVQNDFCPGGALAVVEGDEVIPLLNAWIRKAESSRIPVFFSRDWHPANHVSFKDRGGPWPPHCVQNTRGAAFHRNLYVPQSAVIVSKADTPDTDSYSAFGGTALADLLRAKNVRRLWVGGLALDYCVLRSALDAQSLGFEVHVLRDATRAVNLKAGDDARAVEELKAAGVRVDEDE